MWTAGCGASNTAGAGAPAPGVFGSVDTDGTLRVAAYLEATDRRLLRPDGIVALRVT